MSGLSAYLIGGKVWIVNTPETAQKETPETLPMGSVVMEFEDARLFGAQVLAAALRGEGRL